MGVMPSKHESGHCLDKIGRSEQFLATVMVGERNFSDARSLDFSGLA